MIIPSIGKPKIEYKDHSLVDFESLGFYLNLAKKTISKFAPTFFNGLSKEMLCSEDAISFVANAIMMGDWRWKEQGTTNEKQKSLYSYRNQCAIWAIKTYVTKRYKKTKNYQNTLSLDFMDEDMKMLNVVADTKQTDPQDILIMKENREISKELINSLMQSTIISERQKDYLYMYYIDDNTLEKIGEKYDVTREAVRQGIKSAIKKIQAVL